MFWASSTLDTFSFENTQSSFCPQSKLKKIENAINFIEDKIHLKTLSRVKTFKFGVF